MDTRGGGSMNSSHGGVVDGGATRKLFQQSHTQLGTVSQLLAGGLAGAVSKTCTAPLARLTILFQIGSAKAQRQNLLLVLAVGGTSPCPTLVGWRNFSQVQGMHADVSALSKTSLWHEASRIVNEEGFRAFWKGNLVTIVHRLPYSSVNFYAYEKYKEFLQSVPGFERKREHAGGDVLVHFVSGGMAGITAATATYPLDLVRTRLAAQRNAVYYRGIGHALQTIWKEEGFVGLYKGLGATLLGVGPSIAISFSVYESLRSSWQSQRPNDSPVITSLTCGSLSGIASSAATFPIDLVRRRMQLEGAAGQAPIYRKGLLGTFRHIVTTEGPQGLYRGILPEFYKVVPGVGIAFMTYEALKVLLSDRTDA